MLALDGDELGEASLTCDAEVENALVNQTDSSEEDESSSCPVERTSPNNVMDVERAMQFGDESSQAKRAESPAPMRFFGDAWADGDAVATTLDFRDAAVG